jgi:hypothetical protein
MRGISLILFLLLSLSVFASEFEFNLPASQKVVAVGDIHGDYDGLIKILRGMKLISASGKWTGGKTHLVMLGDLIHKGDESRAVMDFLIELEKEALSAGGRVHSLLANYELMATKGSDRNLTYEDLETYDSYSKDRDQSLMTAYKRAFSGSHKYAKWLRSRPAMVKINDTLFLHGGVTTKMLTGDLKTINKLVREWFMFYQGAAPMPERSTQWVVGAMGPLWSRSVAPYSYELELSELKQVLKHFGVNRIVVGHMKVDSLYDSLYHPEFDGRVFMLETGNSYAMGGKLSAAVIQDGYIFSYKIKRADGEVVFKRKRKLITTSCTSLLSAQNKPKV